MLVKNKERLYFFNDYDLVVRILDDVDVIFMCLPTPEKIGSEGESDLSYYYQPPKNWPSTLPREIKKYQSKRVVIVNKSTVPVKMVNETAKIMEKYGVKNYGLVANPEFLIEGKAVEGSVHPDRVVIGANKEEDFEVMRKLYSRFYNSTSVKYIEVNPYEAAAGKLLANYLLFSRLAETFDVVGRLCESFSDVKFEHIRNILITEPESENGFL